MKDDDWAIQNERGNELLAAGDAAAALVCFNCAIQLQPNNAAIYANLSNALSKLNRLEDAIAAVRQGIRVDPSIPILPHNLSLFLQKARRIDEAVDAATEAVRLNPDDAQYRYTLALALESSGDLDAADREFSEALRIIPNFDRAANSRAFMANFNASFDAARLLDLARDWSTRFEHPGNVVHNNDPNPNRRLKIGYVSATFYDQAEAFFVLPLLESHNREQYEIHCFYNGPFHDVATARHQRTVDGWHEIRGMDDDHAVLLIRQLRIDVLVDLTMHMADSRLRLFALKPAPVQMTWLGGIAPYRCNRMGMYGYWKRLAMMQLNCTFFLELDTGTETLDRLAQKCVSYREYHRSGGYAQFCGLSRGDRKSRPFRVLIVCKSDRRQNNLAERLREFDPPFSTMILTTTYFEYLRNPLGEIWMTPVAFGKRTLAWKAPTELIYCA